MEKLRRVRHFSKAVFFTVCLCASLTKVTAGGSFVQHKIDDGHGKPLVVDVNLDGKNDIVVRGPDAEALAWFEYRGPGKFSKHIVMTNVHFRGDRIDAADIDGDGDLDLATGLGDENSDYKVVWLENPLPTGNPAKPNSWKIHNVAPQVGYIKDLVITDFNGDKKLDIVTRAHTRTVIYFQSSPKDWPQSTAFDHDDHEGMDIGDLDLDGDPDIVLNGFWFETPDDAVNGEYAMHVFDRKWFTAVDNSWRDKNASLRVADINSDGILDILISHSELPGFPVSMYSASSVHDVKAGRWRETRVSEVFDFCQTLDVADFDNDGDLDVLVAKFERDHGNDRYRNYAPFPVAIYYNLDGRGLRWHPESISNDGMYAAVVGDVGSDGDIDVIGARSYWDGPLTLFENMAADKPLTLENWTYIKVDDARDKRFFGLAMADLTGDGNKDIISGRWFYRNPGGDMAASWPRVELPIEVDAILAADVDGDAFGDLIALRCNEQYWFEATDLEGTHWEYSQIGTLPLCDHRLGAQKYSLAQLVPGGKPEILISAGQTYFIEIPDDPTDGNWPSTCVSTDGGGYSAGDIDGDGYLDVAGDFSLAGGDTVPGTRNITWWSSRMAWWKNPGAGGKEWMRYEIGTATHADRCLLADMNGDARLDIVVSEERYPGSVPNANLYWFEQPQDPTTEWKRHLVVTQTSMNNLDVRDVDMDGDTDIITCEHKMPWPGKNEPVPDNERLQVWVNDGRGNFEQKVIDSGKESHLGAQVTDMDNDGDPDIVSIAWRNSQYVHLWRNNAVSKADLPEATSMAPSEERHFLPITVSANSFARIDKAVEVAVDLSRTYAKTGDGNLPVSGNLHLVEVSASGDVLNANPIFQFDKDDDPRLRDQVRGELVFLLDGRTGPHASRYYRLYFDEPPKENPINAFQPLVTVEDIGEYEGDETFKISSRNSVYFYHQYGSGFASLLDRDGNDWISFHPTTKNEDGPKGAYRGIPNIAPPEFHPGSGEGHEKSKVIRQGPLRATILSETTDKAWRCTWDIYPDYATMTLQAKGEEPYWILYEGTPGGEFNLTDYWVHSDGTRMITEPFYRPENQWQSWLPSPKWVYFGDANLDRVLYLIHHEDYEADDQFWHFGAGGMTVFGFGRGPTRENWQQLTRVPVHLTIGFAEDGTFTAAAEVINSAYKPLRITIGEPKRSVIQKELTSN
jgi:hypothetical protein